MSTHLHKPASRFRLSVVYSALSLVTLVLLWRAVDLHVFHKEFLQDQGDARYLRVVPIPAHRGMIMDRHGEPLAISTPVDSVWVQPSAFISTSHAWPKLAKLLKLDLAQLQRTVSQPPLIYAYSISALWIPYQNSPG